MVKVGIVGLGFMGLTHLRAYQGHPRVKLVAVSDTVKERLSGDLAGVQGNLMGAGEKFDFSAMNTYESPHDLLDDPDVELVSLCLPTFLHLEHVEAALARGKHVLCEKPMGLTAQEVDSMVEAARKSSGKLMVAQCIRFWPDYRKARELVQSGELGKVVCARFGRRCALPGWSTWLADESRSGGMILDLSIHDIDFAQHLLGVPEKVRAVGAKDASKGFDHYHATLEIGGVPVVIEGGWFFAGEYPFSMSFDISCQEGVLSFDSSHERPLTIFRADGTTETPELPSGDGYLGEIDYFVRSIEENRAPALSPPEESAVSVKLALLLMESREQGGAEIEIPAQWRRSEG